MYEVTDNKHGYLRERERGKGEGPWFGTECELKYNSILSEAFIECISYSSTFWKQSLDSLIILIRLVDVFLSLTSNVVHPPRIKLPHTQFDTNFLCR